MAYSNIHVIRLVPDVCTEIVLFAGILKIIDTGTRIKLDTIFYYLMFSEKNIEVHSLKIVKLYFENYS